MTIPVVFREGSGKFVFNVDYFDWATGAGYKRYYACGGAVDGTAQYFLTADNSLRADTSNFRLLKNTDTDFDLTFNNPVTVAEGYAYVSYTIYNFDNPGGTETISLVHYDGSTETVLGTATSENQVGNGQARVTLKMATTKKLFKRGDTLRLSIAVGNQTNARYLYIDPSGGYSQNDITYGDNIGSSCFIDIPFVIQP